MSPRRGPIPRPVAAMALAAVVVLAGMVTGPPPTTLARYTDQATSTASLGTDTLAPPTGLGATGGSAVTLTWTPSVDGYATGYSVQRGSASGGPYTQVSTVTPGSATTTTDAPAAGTWWYVLRSTYLSWTSVASGQASAIVGGSTSTGEKACVAASNAADVVNAGDNDGYELNATRVCADDGSFASDDATGNGGTASCGSGATPSVNKDRHRFWGYPFGLPGSVSSIAGITVRADLATNNNGGTTNLCAQLSWDGGTTWTTIKSVAIPSSGMASYSLGSATDTWGHAWTASELGTGAFRVRMIDASTQGNKEFRLDFVGVTVSYVP